MWCSRQTAVAIAFAFSAVVGVVFGIFPANKASRLKPVDALRHDELPSASLASTQPLDERFLNLRLS